MLPLVLVGPIVRRVDSQVASVFIALSRRASVELRIWEGVQVARAGQPGVVKSGASPVATGFTATRQFGENLHVAVVVADLTPPLLPGRRHSYDLVINTGGQGGVTDLRANALLAEGRIMGSDPEAPASLPLGYDQDVLPGFMTCPARIEDLRVVQTGCRCTDAAGDDAMAYIDDLIGSRIEGSVPPPHQLILTGDQIYADRVAAPLLPMVNAVGREMLGGPTEELPVGAGQSLIADTEHLPPLHRKRICSLDAKLTCNSGQSHVFSLAEYCGLYALCWSTSVWRAIPGQDAFPDLAPLNALHREHLTDWDRRLTDPKEREAKKKELLRRWADETQSTRVFRAALAKVARVLANVPTYMLFDDHEITDDWNLTARGRRRTLESPFGQRLILNALSAATVFQAWGNDPRSFEPPPDVGETVNARLLNAVLDGDRDTAIPLLGLHPPLPDVPVRFGFSVDGPAHRLVAIDTRSHRDFPSDFGPPALARPEQIDDQIPEGPLPSGLELLMLLSPAPVVHPPLVDTIGQPLAVSIIDLISAIKGEPEDPGHPEGRRPDVPLLGSAKAEVELWYGDRDAYDNLLKRLSTYPRVVIVSGDVHFSVSLAIDTWLHKNLPGASSRILQLTGSAARNHWEPIVELVLRAFRPFQDLLHLNSATEFITTLTEAIDATATSIQVGIPAPATLHGEPFKIRIDDETMLATAGPSGASPWQVERGLPGSTRAPHEKDARVRHVSSEATVLKWDRVDQPPVEGVHDRRLLELKLKDPPVRLPVTGWPPGSVQRREADFAYRLAVLSDTRPDDERSSQLGALLPPFPDIDPANPLPGYGQTLQRHQAAMQNSAQVRTLVYPHNASEVYFKEEPGDAGLRVVHDLYARLHHADAGVRAEVLTRHESSLEPVDDPRPTIEIES